VRFSLGRDNTEGDVDRVLAVLPGIVERLRAMSPLYNRRAGERPARKADGDSCSAHDHEHAEEG
jgi:hypothetical protein